MAGIVHPNVDTFEMMERERDDAVDLFGIAHIAGQRNRSIEHRPIHVAQSGPRGFRSRCIARQHHHAGSLFCELPGNRLADSHGRTRHHYDFPHKFHARVCIVAEPASQDADGTALSRYNEALVPLLPLFPLDVVLFPGIPLPLHIFEPRYKEMIGECRANLVSFGVVRALENGIAEIGCSAEIVTITKVYPDGRLDLIAQGRQRFEILQVNQERTFLRADVLFLPDEPDVPVPEFTERAIRVHREILNLGGAVQDLSGVDRSSISFHLAGSLPLDLDFKQKLLSMRSESERIRTVTAYLEAILPNLQRASRAKQKSGGNGHVH